MPGSVKVLAWQCIEECEGIDYSVANPETINELADGVILPPVSMSEVASTLAASRSEELKTSLGVSISEIVEKAKGYTLPDGRPYLFPNGINSIDLELNFGDPISLTIKVDGTAGPSGMLTP